MLMPQGDNSICRIPKTCRHSGPRCLATGSTIEPWRDLFPSSCADCHCCCYAGQLANEWVQILAAGSVRWCCRDATWTSTHTHKRGPHCFKLGFRLQQSSAKWRVLATASKHPNILFLFLFFQSRHLSPHRGVVLRCTFVLVALSCLHSWPDRDGTGLQSGAQTWQQTYSVVLFVLSHSLCNVLSLCVSSFSPQVGTVKLICNRLGDHLSCFKGHLRPLNQANAKRKEELTEVLGRGALSLIYICFPVATCSAHNLLRNEKIIVSCI